MSRRESSDQPLDKVSEFDRGRIVAYRDCGLHLSQEIGSRVVTKPSNFIKRICDRLDAEGYDGPTWSIASNLSAPLHARRQENCAHGSDGSLSHITNRSTAH
ncbi:hypothetical protein TNCV_874171 [Trichonephila clavipes]|nr:hypothetical protein TNCV_874171 [Trichonephila clavipes]